MFLCAKTFQHANSLYTRPEPCLLSPWPCHMDAIYLARDDAHNVDIWSGSPHWIGRTLASIFNLQYICPLKGRFNTWYRIKGRILRALGYGHTRDGEWPFLKA